MPVYLPTAVVGNDRTLLTLGHAGEIMGWFYPSKDHSQHIYQCMPCVYVGAPYKGQLYWTWGDEWQRRQAYLGDSNICVTTLRCDSLGLEVQFSDVVPDDTDALVRQISVRNLSSKPRELAVFQFGDWNMAGIRVGNALEFNHEIRALVQSHHDAAVVIGGDALESWHCGKAGRNWGSNAMYALEAGVLQCQNLEIGDVNWAFGFRASLKRNQAVQRTALYAMGKTARAAVESWKTAASRSFAGHCAERKRADAAWLAPGLEALKRAFVQSENRISRSGPSGSPDAASASKATSAADARAVSPGQGFPVELLAAYKRSILCLPLLCGEEGVALAAPEFDPEFISCGGYGYFWPRDGSEYVSGFMDAGYPQFAERLFDWCQIHQDPAGLWHQRYFLNGALAPNWCLPPDTLQIDQVGAVLWVYGKMRLADSSRPADAGHLDMVRRAADYLVSRLTDQGVHANAFDTWESFVGSFTYSNSSIYAGLRAAALVLNEPAYDAAADRIKAGVRAHFMKDDYLIRGFNAGGGRDEVVDSSSLGAIEPFGLLDLKDPQDLEIAEATLRVTRERLEQDWEGGKAIRRFEWDAYVGGVPACVNTLWMARCCLKLAHRLQDLDRAADAAALTEQAQVYLTTVLRRTTPTGLLPELMQGPTGQPFWAAPHGWAMASFVSGVLMLASRWKR